MSEHLAHLDLSAAERISQHDVFAWAVATILKATKEENIHRVVIEIDGSIGPDWHPVKLLVYGYDERNRQHGFVTMIDQKILEAKQYALAPASPPPENWTEIPDAVQPAHAVDDAERPSK